MAVQRSPATYSTGTIYGQIGTQAIVGAGTSWTVTDGSGAQVSNIAPFDTLWVDGQVPILIKSIEDDQHLTLGSKLPFGIPAGTAYKIIKSTVSPSAAVLGLLQKIAALGTSASPLTYEAFDNGVSAFQIGFTDDGRIRLRVGAAGADGSTQHPWRDAFLIDPSTGNVTATGLGSGSGSANRFWYITGKPANSVGIDGDVNFDFVTGFVVYRKNAGIWSAGLDILGTVNAASQGAAASAMAADTSAKAAAASAASAAALLATSATDGQVRLKYVSATQIALVPVGGGNIVVAGTQVQVPSAGVTIGNGSIGANAFAHVYLYVDGTTKALTLAISQTGYASDANGRKVHSGNAGLRWVGMVYTDGSGKFRDDPTFRGVFSAFNRLNKMLRTSFVNTTSSSSYTIIGGPIIFIVSDEDVRLGFTGYVSQNTSMGGGYATTNITIDGSQQDAGCVGNFASGYQSFPAVKSDLYTLGESAHSLFAGGLVSSGEGKWSLTLNGEVRC